MTLSLRRYRFMVVILAITAYLPTVKTGFMWDDHVMIEENFTLRSWSSDHLKHDFTSDVFDGHGDRYYRPLQTIVNRIDYTLWGLQPLGYHITNLLFHIGNALLVLELILALGFLPLTAYLAGSLFAVHPIVVEQLMIIAGRAELMGLFFVLASILLFLRQKRGATMLAWVAYILALLCKESSILVPILLALIYAVQKRRDRSSYLHLIPLVFVWPFYFAIRHYAVGPILDNPDRWLAVRFFFQEFPSVIIQYGSLLLFPWNLHSHRLLPHLSHFWLLYLLGTGGAIVYLIKRFGSTAGFCVGWFLLTLLPKTPVMIYGNFMLDHWAYPALIAVVLPLALIITRGWNARKEYKRSLAALLYFGAVIMGSLLVHLNVAIRGTDESMYRWALRFTTSNPVKYNLGVLLLQTHRPDEAASYLEDVQRYYPEDPNTTRALALAYWGAGHRRAAVSLLEHFTRQYPQHPFPQQMLHAFRKQLKSR